MTKVTFEVDPTTAQWGYDQTAYPSGTTHEVEADGDFAAALAAAEAAGAISITEESEPLPEDHIETDEQSLAFRERVDALRAETQGERDVFVRDLERQLAQRVADSDDEMDAGAASRELEASVNELDRDLLGSEIDALKES